MNETPIDDIGYPMAPRTPAGMGGCFEDVLAFEALTPERRVLYRKQAQVNAMRGCWMCRQALDGSGALEDYPVYARKAHMMLCANPDSDFNVATRKEAEDGGRAGEAGGRIGAAVESVRDEGQPAAIRG